MLCGTRRRPLVSSLSKDVFGLVVVPQGDLQVWALAVVAAGSPLGVPHVLPVVLGAVVPSIVGLCVFVPRLVAPL